MADRHHAVDGLRALAIFAVLGVNFRWVLPFGWMGVQLFFVLSGWLITQILLDEKQQSAGAGGYFGRFYFRRSLRIFPLYFALLLGIEAVYGLWAAPPQWSAVRPYAFGYAVNFGMLARQVDAHPAYGHLWTLAVEEQFYLVWPLLVWLLSRRAMARLALGLVVLGPLLRLGMAWRGWDPGMIYVATWSHLDALSMGSLLALYDWRAVRNASRVALPVWLVTVLLGVGVLAHEPELARRTLGYPEGLGAGHAYIWGYTALDLSFALLVLAAARRELGWLAHPLLAYLGRISYGLYVFHRPVIALYEAWPAHPVLAAWPEWPRNLAGLGCCALLTTGLAALSYHGFERPLLRWRDRKVPARARTTATLLGQVTELPESQATARPAVQSG